MTTIEILLGVRVATGGHCWPWGALARWRWSMPRTTSNARVDHVAQLAPVNWRLVSGRLTE